MQGVSIRAQLPNQRVQGHPGLLRRTTLQRGLQPARQNNQAQSAQDGELTETEGGEPPEDIAPANKGIYHDAANL